jgi:hypothetical protein
VNPKIKRAIAAIIPGIGALAIALPIWTQIADDDTPPALLTAKVAIIATALKQTLDVLEREGLLPAWLETNPTNDHLDIDTEEEVTR